MSASYLLSPLKYFPKLLCLRHISLTLIRIYILILWSIVYLSTATCRIYEPVMVKVKVESQQFESLLSCLLHISSTLLRIYIFILLNGGSYGTVKVEL